MGFYIEELPTELNGITMEEADYLADEFLKDEPCNRMWDAMRALRDFYETVTSEAVEIADRKTEPSICDGCKFYDGEDCYSQEPCKVKTEPQTDSLEQFRVGLEYHTDTTHFGKVKGESITTNKVEDKPQTDGYMTAEQAEDYRKMLDKAEHKVYGNIEDEPQTDCSWQKGE